MDVSRRQFFKICAGGMAGTTVAALGFAPKQALAQARNYKLLRAKEIRNTCLQDVFLRNVTGDGDRLGQRKDIAVRWRGKD